MKLRYAFLVFFVSISHCYSFEMVTIPKGNLNPFWLTPKATKNGNVNLPKLISVQSFQMMKYPVTKLEYKNFLKGHPKWRKENIPQVFADETYLKSFSKKENKLNEPVTEISWFSARAFCKSKNMRLPTINEWEYAAAASEVQTDANQDEKFLRRILEWYGEPSGAEPKVVGSIYKNIYGVWDLHGLIWEWVEDFNSSFVTGESREDSSFDKNLFCGAGGLSGANKENYAAFMRFAFRSSLKANSSVWNLGFRCVR